MKDKYNDNKLAEEFDLIVLTDATCVKNGLPKGALGTLTYAYTGASRPLYALCTLADGSQQETALALDDFRVLNISRKDDLRLLSAHLRAGGRKKA